MSHPSLGLPPHDRTAGSAAGAARLRARRSEIVTRAVQVALDRRPATRERRDEAGLRKYVHDAGVFLDQAIVAVATGDPTRVGEFAGHVSPVYRRQRVPIDELIALCEGLRAATAEVLLPDERPLADGAFDAAIDAFRWHRRIAGDARPRNPILDAIYKGA